jgi:hypothetical protein
LWMAPGFFSTVYDVHDLCVAKQGCYLHPQLLISAADCAIEEVNEKQTAVLEIINLWRRFE